MEFVLTFHQPAEVFEVNDDPVRGVAPMQAWKLYMEAMVAAGIVRAASASSTRRTPSACATASARCRTARSPTPRTLLGGYFVVDVSPLDEALEWAERCAGRPWAAPCSAARDTRRVTPRRRRGGRAGRPRQLRPAGGLAGLAVARPRRRRGRARRSVRRALERWPVQGVPDAPEAWLLPPPRRQLLMPRADSRLAEDPRSPPVPGDARAAPEAAAAARCAAAADVRLRPPRDRCRRAQRADAADGAGPGRRAHRQRLPGQARGDDQAPGARQGQDPRRRAALRGARPANGPSAWPSVLEAIYGAYTLHWGHGRRRRRRRTRRRGAVPGRAGGRAACPTSPRRWAWWRCCGCARRAARRGATASSRCTSRILAPGTPR